MTSITTTRAQNAAHEAAKAAFPEGALSADRAAFLIECAALELIGRDSMKEVLEAIYEAMTGDPADVLNAADSAAKAIMEWAEYQDGLDHGDTTIARKAA